MLLRGELADSMAATAPEAHGPHLIKDKNGKSTLCVLLCKALHGAVKSALLWWQELSNHLIKLGFKLNPCDKCVANKNINGKQRTMQ